MRLNRLGIATIALVAAGFTFSPVMAKIAVIDEMAVLSSVKMQKEIKPFKNKAAVEEVAVEKLGAQYQTLQTEYDQNEAVMDEKARTEAQKKIVETSRELQKSFKTMETNAQEMSKRINQQMRDAATKISKVHKIDLLLKGDAIVYADSVLDVTQDFIKALGGVDTDIHGYAS